MNSPAPSTDWLRALREHWRDFSQSPPVAKVLHWIRRGLFWAALIYAGALIAVLALMEWYGERHPALCLLLYLPPQGWLLPLLALTPLTLIFHYRVCLVHLGCVLLVLGIYMAPRWSVWPAAKGPTLTLVTNNVGQNNRQSPRPFWEAEQADVIALQETGRGAAYAKAYPDWHVESAAQLVLISRYPIVSVREIKAQSWHNHTVAARFELDCEGKPLVIYNVHLPSPRRDLQRLAGRGFIVALFGWDGTEDGRIYDSLADPWHARRELGKELAEVFRQEKLPFLAVGDFNFPDHGYLYRRFASEWTDAFAARGRGYGFTFPGYTRNPLTLFGPWLRLDYLFSSQELAPIYCRREPGRKSQHRAVAARFQWRDTVGVSPAP